MNFIIALLSAACILILNNYRPKKLPTFSLYEIMLDEEIELSSLVNISICQSSDGTQRLEGEMWTLSPCLRCICHSGQVLCVSPECPPAPCDLPTTAVSVVQQKKKKKEEMPSRVSQVIPENPFASPMTLQRAIPMGKCGRYVKK